MGRTDLGCSVCGQGDMPHALSQLCNLLAGGIGVVGQPQLYLLYVFVPNNQEAGVCYVTQNHGTQVEDLQSASSFHYGT